MNARETAKRNAAGPRSARRRALWALASAGAIGLSTIAVYLGWRGFRLLSSDDLGTSDTAAGIQGLAAAANLVATLFLVGITTAYVVIAYQHLRLSRPDVSIDWHLAWANLSGSSREVLRAPIESLRNGPMDESHNAPFIAVELINSGNQSVAIEQMQLVVDDDSFYHGYGGSQLSRECPVDLGPHSSQTLYFDQFEVRHFLLKCESLKPAKPHELHARVRLGSGVTLSTSTVPLECLLASSSAATPQKSKLLASSTRPRAQANTDLAAPRQQPPLPAPHPEDGFTPSAPRPTARDQKPTVETGDNDKKPEAQGTEALAAS